MKTIGVIIPNYNSGTYIRKCLDSLLEQEYKVNEIIVEDDCSTDDSPKIVKEYINDGIYAIRIENALFVKRLQYMPGKLLVKSDNPIYQPFEVDLKTDSVNIIGAVVYVMNDMSCI